MPRVIGDLCIIAVLNRQHDSINELLLSLVLQDDFLTLIFSRQFR